MSKSVDGLKEAMLETGKSVTNMDDDCMDGACP